MDDGDREPGAPLAWGVAERALPGEPVSGDAYAFVPTERGTLVAVVDGLGHGPEAAAAARAATDVLARYAGDPLPVLLERCHLALRYTRGAALTLARIDAGGHRIEWIGVGNVDAQLVRAGRPADGPARVAGEGLLLRAGVVGYRIPDVQAATVAFEPGDTLAIATDGLDPAFATELDRAVDPQVLAERLLERHGKATDDALVLVLRAGAS